MPYRLVYTGRALCDMGKLDVVARKRLKRALGGLANDPLKQSRKLINSKIGQYRLRVADHRVVFDVAGDEIVVLRVGHRRDIYR